MEFPFALPKTQLPCAGLPLCSGGQEAAQAVLAGKRLRGGSGSACGGPWLRRGGRPGRRAAGQTSVSSRAPPSTPAGPDGEGVFVRVLCSHFFFFLEPCDPSGGAGFPVLFLCGAPPRDASAGCCPGGGGGSQRLFLLLSVLSHLSQLGCQVDGNVFIQGVVRDVREVVQVVEAVHRLPLLRLPQQSVPVKRGHRGRL